MTAEQGSSAASVYGQTDSGLSSVDSIPAHAINSRISPRRAGLFATLALAVAACGIGLKPTERTEVFEEDVAITDGIDYSDFYSEALTPDPFLEPGREIAVGGDQGDAGDTSAIVREIGSPFSTREDIRINYGRHGKNGSAVDLALLEMVECNRGVMVGNGPLKDWTVVATESGELTVVGGEKIIVDGKEITDPNRSVVIVKNDKGKVGYVHIQPLDALKRRVKSGDKSIEQGEPIGKVTCEFPPGGDSTGMHLHLFTIDSEGNAEPFGASMEGWQFGLDPQSGETIATKGNETRYPCLGICNSGPRKNVLPIGDPNATIPRVREPKPVQPTQTEESLDGPFVPKNPEEFARYRIIGSMLEGSNRSWGGGWSSFSTDYFYISDEQIEALKQAVAKGEDTEPISFLKITYVNTTGEYIPDGPELPILYVHDPNGDIYERAMQFTKGSFRNLGINIWEYGMPEVRHAEYVAWGGEISIWAEFKYGVVDIKLRGTLEDFERWEAKGYQSIIDRTITKLSPWVDDSTGRFNVYVYKNGDVECVVNTIYNDVALCTGGLAYGLWGHDDGGYNGEFVIEP